jgi:hypothetical protein
MAASITTTSTTLEGQLYEIAREMQEKELSIPEETRPNNTNLAFDLEAGTVAITVTLPITIGGSGNQVILTAGTYLS